MDSSHGLRTIEPQRISSEVKEFMTSMLYNITVYKAYVHLGQVNFDNFILSCSQLNGH